MYEAFTEIKHSETPFFHLSIGKMSITLDDVSCLIHLHIMIKLLYHIILNRDKANETIIIYCEDDPTNFANDIADTRGAHVRFKFLEKLYKSYL